MTLNQKIVNVCKITVLCLHVHSCSSDWLRPLWVLVIFQLIFLMLSCLCLSSRDQHIYFIYRSSYFTLFECYFIFSRSFLVQCILFAVLVGPDRIESNIGYLMGGRRWIGRGFLLGLPSIDNSTLFIERLLLKAT